MVTALASPRGLDARAGSGRHLVGEIFEGVALFYEEIVEMATCGEDRAWKEELLGLLHLLHEPRRVLDLACGTGILTFMIRDRFPRAEVVGVDLTASLLSVAAERGWARGDGQVRFVQGAAEDVDIPGPFDAVVSCYLPKYADLARLVSLVTPLLVPGGLFAMQDFTFPSQPEVRRAWLARFEHLRGWARSRRPEAERMFELLPGVIRSSDWSTRLPRLLEEAGLEEVRVTRQTWGTSAIVFARAPRRGRATEIAATAS